VHFHFAKQRHRRSASFWSRSGSGVLGAAIGAAIDFPSAVRIANITTNSGVGRGEKLRARNTKSGRQPMPMIFDPLATRNAFDEFQLQMTLSEQDGRSPAMGHMAVEHVGDVVDAWLVGLQSEISPALPRALTWLDRAISEREEFGTSLEFHRLSLLWAKALGSWLYTGASDATAWEAVRAQSLLVSSDRESFSADMIPVEWLDDHMAFCIQAGNWQGGIEDYEKLRGNAPAPGRSRTPRDFGYAYCLAQARGAFDAAQVLAAGRRMLEANLQHEWLGRGQKIRAATWLKVVCWEHDRSRCPLQTILSAYDHMPKVQRPDFLPADASGSS
jgi:hypothetical protein